MGSIANLRVIRQIEGRAPNHFPQQGITVEVGGEYNGTKQNAEKKDNSKEKHNKEDKKSRTGHK